MNAPFKLRASAVEGADSGTPLFTVEEVVEVTSAHVMTPDSHRLRDKIRRVSTDSRDVRPGDLFVALKGERYDGHEFVDAAFRQGAMGAVVGPGYRLPTSFPPLRAGSSRRPHRGPPLVLSVHDPLFAYQQLSTHHRNRFDMPVVAVTGSNGKTTTKEMIARVLDERWSVLKTEGNLNNRIGVPQTLLRLTVRHTAAVIEMGVDHKGQTARLTEIVRPTIGVITNIGPDHLEFFGTLGNSAQAKGELLDLMQPDDAVVLNADDAFFDYLASRARCRVISFGLSAKAQVRAADVTPARGRGTAFRLILPGKARSTPIAIHAFGLHNVENALAAAAVGHLCGLSGASIAAGLSRFRPATMRSQVETHGGIKIINDCYNANPASMNAAIDLLAELGAGGRTIAVLGDMLELGPESSALHHEVGAHLAAKDISFLIACGPLSRALAQGAHDRGMARARIREAADAAEATQVLTSMLRRHDVVLAKASRGMRMEQVVEALRRRLAVRRAPVKSVATTGKGRTR
ncbi:MAG TPA: UDP-N-acetylmuramoyl-tripeptide--D-alanyl-D-alanine ligase [Nitrospiraceae bacterium]|nr:UDP-N-acetylmuramoyl-tripeptide--D-alanyl-D-alanine ligase [Nitrospiraceae bacterium]